MTIVSISGPHEAALSKLRAEFGVRDASTVVWMLIEEKWRASKLGEFPVCAPATTDSDRLYSLIAARPGISRSKLLAKWRRAMLDHLLCELAGRVRAHVDVSGGRPVTTYTVVPQ